MTILATTVPIESSVAEFIGQPRKILIGGEWVEAASGKTFDTYNPATGDVLGRIAEGEREDIDRAVKAARKAFEGGRWTGMPCAEKGRLLWKLADLIERHSEELAQMETLDNGKPIFFSRGADIPAIVETFRYFAGWATKIEGNTIPLSADGKYFAYTVREPIGVVGQIIPWNFPLILAANKLAPALAAGCTVILKPAEQSSLPILRLAELIMEAGFPDGVVNVVSGLGETAGAALAAHPDVDKISFTGSTEVGRLIINAAAGNLKKVSLELGGKSPNIVFADADIEAAIDGAAEAIFFNQGQCCTAGSRLFVQNTIFDEVVDGVVRAAKQLQIGPGMDPSTRLGPLVSREQLERVCSYMEAGMQDGATAVIGGHRIKGKGYFVEPTVFIDVKPNMKVAREEIFGPVVTAIPFDDLEDVSGFANDTVYGLAAAVWTRDISKAHKMAASLRAGTVWINCYNVFHEALPFGGYKQSGWGRESGHTAFDSYTETKSVCIKL